MFVNTSYCPATTSNIMPLADSLGEGVAITSFVMGIIMAFIPCAVGIVYAAAPLCGRCKPVSSPVPREPAAQPLPPQAVEEPREELQKPVQEKQIASETLAPAAPPMTAKAVEQLATAVRGISSTESEIRAEAYSLFQALIQRKQGVQEACKSAVLCIKNPDPDIRYKGYQLFQELVGHGHRSCYEEALQVAAQGVKAVDHYEANGAYDLLEALIQQGQGYVTAFDIAVQAWERTEPHRAIPLMAALAHQGYTLACEMAKVWVEQIEGRKPTTRTDVMEFHQHVCTLLPALVGQGEVAYYDHAFASAQEGIKLLDMPHSSKLIFIALIRQRYAPAYELTIDWMGTPFTAFWRDDERLWAAIAHQELAVARAISMIAKRLESEESNDYVWALNVFSRLVFNQAKHIDQNALAAAEQHIRSKNTKVQIAAIKLLCYSVRMGILGVDKLIKQLHADGTLAGLSPLPDELHTRKTLATLRSRPGKDALQLPDDVLPLVANFLQGPLCNCGKQSVVHTRAQQDC